MRRREVEWPAQCLRLAASRAGMWAQCPDLHHLPSELVAPHPAPRDGSQPNLGARWAGRELAHVWSYLAYNNGNFT